MRRLPRMTALAALGVLALGCSGKEKKPGTLMLAVSTDMYIDKDLSRVDVIVQPENGPTQSVQVNLFPELDGKFLPGTFAINEGNTPGEFVRIRVVARKGDSVRVVREAATRIPKERTAMLPMPIQWLCDGVVTEQEKQYRSDCDDDYTCIAGTCQSALVDETKLPDYEPAEVFGGGTAAGGGECFDTIECLAGEPHADVQMGDCSVAVPQAGEPNVAVVLPPDSEGHCTNQECLIPLDRSELGGFSLSGGRIQLPLAVCDRLNEGSIDAVVVSGKCDSKLPNTPTCGPWTLVGTEPGDEPGPVEPGPGSPGGVKGLADLSAAVDELAMSVATGCASIAGVAVPEAPNADDVSLLCGEAVAALSGSGPFQWYHVPTRCWPDAEAQLACERECDPSCDPGTLEDRCEAGSLSGACEGACESRLCLATAAAPDDCEGACAGECDGQCDGNCFGECVGDCTVTSPDGYCEGVCTGQCAGQCEGRCAGTCAGQCNRDPNLAPTSCGADVDCYGSCPGGFTSAHCEGPLGNNVCNLDSVCALGCEALGLIGVECADATAWVMPKSGASSEQLSILEQALALLAPVVDLKQPILTDGGLKLKDQYAADPEAGNSIQDLIDAIASIGSSANNVLSVVGDPRNGLPMGPGPGPGPGPVDVDCSLAAPTGGELMIDDFDDQDDLLLNTEARTGGWFIVNDGTGVQSPAGILTPESGGPSGSGFALHTSGTNFMGWGAGVGFDFRAEGGAYDASSFTGIRFWARGDTPLRIVAMQADLMDMHPCGTCDANLDTCNAFYSAQVMLTSNWAEYSVPFGDFSVEPMPASRSFDPGQLIHIDFEAPPAASFDFWLDDLQFY